MNDKLREKVDEIFQNAPNCRQTVEIKEEILQNTIDRYNDLMAEGKTEQAAFNIAVAGIGDVSSLIEEIKSTMPSVPQEEIDKERKRNALLHSISIMLYILCVVPVITIQNEIGVVLMFVMIAVATGLIIYRGKTKSRYIKNPDTVADEFKEWSNQKNEDTSLIKTLSTVVWILTIISYIFISLSSGAWYITWIIFFIGAAITNIIKACFDLKK